MGLEVLFSPINMTRLVVQESVVLSKCHILHDMTLWFQMSYYQGVSRELPISM